MFSKPTFNLSEKQRITDIPDLKSGLKMTNLFKWMPVSVNSDDNEMRQILQDNAPTSSPDIAEWMHVSTTDKAVLNQMANDSSSNNGVIRTDSGDGYIPGVSTNNMRAESTPAYRLGGSAVVHTSVGNFEVPRNEGRTFAKDDLLAWANLPSAYGIQYTINLIEYEKLPSARNLNNRLRFPNCHGNVAPQFLTLSTSVPSPVANARMKLTSNKTQTMKIRGRGTEGDYQTVHFEDEIELDEGQTEYIYSIQSLPYVQAMTLELQPEDNTSTILDSMTVYP